MEQENNNFNDNVQQENNNIQQENNVSEESFVNNEVQNDNMNSDDYQQTNVDVEPQFDVSFDDPPVEKKSNGKMIALVILLILLIAGLGIFLYFTLFNKKEKAPEVPVDEPAAEETKNENEEENPNDYLAYQIKGNAIGDFDLQFLKLENKKENIIYSPLSIKYALEMLKEGANGQTKEQIERIVGDYVPKKYKNNANMSFANAMFIRDSYKKFVKDTYTKALKEIYNAEVVYDSFKNPDNINKWINKNTFKLINNLIEDVNDANYILVNALAIDMEWVNKLQRENEFWAVGYIHEDYSKYIDALGGSEKTDGDEPDYNALEFKDSPKVAAVEIGAVANRYDIVKEMGESKVREIVGNDYQKWLDEGAENSCYDPEYSDESEKDPDRETYVNNYIKEINKNYNQLDSSTDFDFYVDENIKMISKDLKESSGTTLKYIAIMPTKLDLPTFIKSSNADDIKTLISKLKPMKVDSFKDGVISEITGYIPMFNFDYKLDLNNDLKKIGITNIFDANMADFSNLTTEKMFITNALHKATIDFSNSGIKAAAVTAVEMGGGGDCGYDYIFKIPENRIQKIDLTFNRPFLFLIVDKNTNEVWFTGSVYKPAEYNSYIKSIKMYYPWEEDN